MTNAPTFQDGLQDVNAAVLDDAAAVARLRVDQAMSTAVDAGLAAEEATALPGGGPIGEMSAGQSELALNAGDAATAQSLEQSALEAERTVEAAQSQGGGGMVAA